MASTYIASDRTANNSVLKKILFLLMGDHSMDRSACLTEFGLHDTIIPLIQAWE